MVIVQDNLRSQIRGSSDFLLRLILCLVTSTLSSGSVDDSENAKAFLNTQLSQVVLEEVVATAEGLLPLGQFSRRNEVGGGV